MNHLLKQEREAKNCWCQLEGSSTGSKLASVRSLGGDNIAKNTNAGSGDCSKSRMKKLSQHKAFGVAQNKNLKIASASCGGRLQAAIGP